MIVPYEVISSEKQPLSKTFGAGCISIERITFGLMSQMCGDHYKGGLWEFRKYPNGALVMVYPDATVIKPETLNGYEIECSLEAVSYGAYLIALSTVLSNFSSKGDRYQMLINHINDHFYAARDAVSGLCQFVVKDGYCNGYTAIDPEKVLGFEPAQTQHKEASAIYSIID